MSLEENSLLLQRALNSDQVVAKLNVVDVSRKRRQWPRLESHLLHFLNHRTIVAGWSCQVSGVLVEQRFWRSFTNTNY